MSQPSWVEPMKATLTDRPFSDPAWIFEPKLDGVRCLAYCRAGTLSMFSRNRKPLQGAFPEIAEALEAYAGRDFIADGEVVAMKGGVSSFSLLQNRSGLRDPAAARARGVAIHYYLFDLLYLDGQDLRPRPLLERKALLRRTFFPRGASRGTVRYTGHRPTHGEKLFERACREQRLEGLIAKRADGRYVAGRSRDWLKLKCSNQQEFVIGGFTDPQRSRVGLGALLVGYDEGRKLIYAGMVGTGFNQAMLRRLRQDLEAIERDTPPFEPDVFPRRARIHWVEPRLVAQVAFSEWTANGKLRHPRFLGLRQDKPARQVVREQPGA